MMAYNRCVIPALLLIVLIAFYTTSTEACSCQPNHPQRYYCDSSYVIYARILNKRIENSTNPYGNQIVYKIDIRKQFKMSEKAAHHLRKRKLVTSEMSSCRVDLKVGKLYAIAASTTNIGTCNYIKEYRDLTIVERRGISGGYTQGCGCRFNLTYRNLAREYKDDQCNYSFFSQCETDFGVCIPKRRRGTIRNSEKPIRCHWRATPKYNNCINIDP